MAIRLLVSSAACALAFTAAPAHADTGQSCSKVYAGNLIAIAQKYGAAKPPARTDDVNRANAGFVECIFSERQPETVGDLIGAGHLLTSDGQFVQVNPDGDWVLYIPPNPDAAHQRATQIDANLRAAIGDGAGALPLRWDGLPVAEQRAELAALEGIGGGKSAPQATFVPAVSLTPDPADLERLQLSSDLDAALADAASNAGPDANDAYKTANQQATQRWTNNTQQWVQGYVEAVIRARAQQQQEQDEEDAQQQADDQQAAEAFSAFLGGLAQGLSAAAQQQEIANQQAQISQSFGVPTYHFTPSPEPATEPIGTAGFIDPPTTTAGDDTTTAGQSGSTTTTFPGSTGVYPTGGAANGGGDDENDPANNACCDGTPAIPERNFDPQTGDPVDGGGGD